MNRQTQDRNAAILWARSVLDQSHKYYILDTETTGLDNPEVIELAVIDLNGEMMINQRFNPITTIEPGATDIHGLTSEMLATKPQWPIVGASLERDIFHRKLLIYDRQSNYSAICNTYDLHHIPLYDLVGECVLTWYSQFIGEWYHHRQSYRLQALPGDAISALGDCIATLEVIKMMARSSLVEDLVPDRPSQISAGPIGNEEKIAS
jgi:DNA polymerase III subunit epsilon